MANDGPSGPHGAYYDALQPGMGMDELTVFGGQKKVELAAANPGEQHIARQGRAAGCREAAFACDII